jgi:hypothetical protein
MRRRASWHVHFAPDVRSVPFDDLERHIQPAGNLFARQPTKSRKTPSVIIFSPLDIGQRSLGAIGSIRWPLTPSYTACG